MGTPAVFRQPGFVTEEFTIDERRWTRIMAGEHAPCDGSNGYHCLIAPLRAQRRESLGMREQPLICRTVVPAIQRGTPAFVYLKWFAFLPWRTVN